MNSEDIYKGIGGISPDLLEEAETHNFSVRRKPRILKWAAAAAVFVVLCGVGVYGATGGFTVKKLLLNGYEVKAHISRIPMKAIKGNVNEASVLIPEQYKNYSPYSSLFPGSFYKNVSSAEEAAAYIGYDKLQIPVFPYDHTDNFQVAVVGGQDGRISQIQIMRDAYSEKVSAQNWTTLFTEHYDGDVFDIGFAGDPSAEMQEFTTANKLRCIVFESDAQLAGRKSLTAYITTGDVVYMCHSAFNTADRAEAEKIIHDWAESIK
ncbi:MAG: hypothetical protein IJK77_03450 [Lachnospiraceae bacterium]|nr:hypothetical protein [Lachnospiraceae bacterium]